MGTAEGGGGWYRPSMKLVVVVAVLLLVAVVVVKVDDVYDVYNDLLLPWDEGVAGNRPILPPPVPNALVNSYRGEK